MMMTHGGDGCFEVLHQLGHEGQEWSDLRERA